MINKIDAIDKRASATLHEMNSKTFELFLLPMGFMFSTYGAPMVGTILWLKIIFVEAKLGKLATPTRRD